MNPVTLQKKFDKVSTAVLAIYSNKMLAYIGDINRSMIQLNKLYNKKDILFDSKTRGDVLQKKISEAENMYNRIHIELERRCAKDLDFKFEYSEVSKIVDETEKMFREVFPNDPTLR